MIRPHFCNKRLQLLKYLVARFMLSESFDKELEV